LQTGQDLWRNREHFSGFGQATPETNRKRSPRKMAAMSMYCSSCVETRSFPHAASIATRGASGGVRRSGPGSGAGGRARRTD
jgi:hypothetical protein